MLSSRFQIHSAVSSSFLPEVRDIIVYTPPDYASSSRSYPVLYLQDGQNLFDAETAFLHNEWGLGPTLDELIDQNQIEPPIVVGVYNAGVRRVFEYTYLRDRTRRAGGQALTYGKFLIRELKPYIDSTYRTLSDHSNTGLGGSSLGALVTLYLGLANPNVFGSLLVMSPSVWWANRSILREVRKRAPSPGQRIWLDIGTQEGPDAELILADARLLRDALVAKGWRPDQDLAYFEDVGGGHNEKAWGLRMRKALPFLFPKKARQDEFALTSTEPVSGTSLT